MRHQKRPEGELTPAPRIEINGISNMDTEEAGKQRIAVTIAEMYACGHSGTKSTGYHGMLVYMGWESLDIQEEPWLG